MVPIKEQPVQSQGHPSCSEAKSLRYRQCSELRSRYGTSLNPGTHPFDLSLHWCLIGPHHLLEERQSACSIAGRRQTAKESQCLPALHAALRHSEGSDGIMVHLRYICVSTPAGHTQPARACTCHGQTLCDRTKMKMPSLVRLLSSALLRSVWRAALAVTHENH